jgi:hypothetical protein
MAISTANISTNVINIDTVLDNMAISTANISTNVINIDTVLDNMAISTANISTNVINIDTVLDNIAISTANISTNVINIDTVLDNMALSMANVSTNTLNLDSLDLSVGNIEDIVSNIETSIDLFSDAYVKTNGAVAHNAITDTATSAEIDLTGYKAVTLYTTIATAGTWKIDLYVSSAPSGSFKPAYDIGGTLLTTGNLTFAANPSSARDFKVYGKYLKIIATEVVGGGACTVNYTLGN